MTNKIKDYNSKKDGIDCKDGEDYQDKLKSGIACNFEYDNIFEKTPCSEENEYGYNSNKPCVLIKLNKLIDFIPKIQSNSTGIEIKCYADVMLC